MNADALLERFRPLFDPRGIIIAGASSHPGKFGFVAAHNILGHGYTGKVFMTNREGSKVLGRQTLRSVEEVPAGQADLVFVCTPASTIPDLLRTCAEKGVRAAFISSAGYGEVDEEGRRAEQELAALCDELDIVMAGPNGQGIISTPSSLCAQIIAPYPPSGRIAVASQSGGFVQSFLNYARKTGVGVSRAISAGNSAQTRVEDYLEYLAVDPETGANLIYVEGIENGRAFYDKARTATGAKPLVVLKGGSTASGARAAASHTGALATDDKVFDGMCRQAGVSRATTVEEAFEIAASFACHPIPEGPNVFVLTTAGGWGVVAADRLTESRELELMPLPADLERNGPFYPDHGLERIVEYHERQDTRYATAAIEAERKYGKPILVATELSDTQPENPGVATLMQHQSLVYPSSYRAVTALEHLFRYGRFRARHGLPPLRPDSARPAGAR